MDNAWDPWWKIDHAGGYLRSISFYKVIKAPQWPFLPSPCKAFPLISQPEIGQDRGHSKARGGASFINSSKLEKIHVKN